jgi:uncharacterized lipoprotein YmbA
MSAMATRRMVVGAAVTLCVMMAGCLSKKYPVKQRHVMRIQRAGASTPASLGVLRVGRMRVSPLFERKGFVYRTGDTTFEQDFYNEFFVPPGVLLRKATLDWMGASSLFSSVIDAADAATANWLLQGRMEKLYGDFRDGDAPRAVLAIEFTLLDLASPQHDVALRKTYAREVEAAVASPAAVMAAWNQALSQILAELEADLRREALASSTAGDDTASAAGGQGH